MNLLRHETLTILRRWSWIIPVWWLTVAIDLGYQCAWWWERDRETTGWRDQFHSEMFDWLYWLIWIGLLLPAISLFAAISPERSRSPERIRPIRERERIGARLVVLAIAIGLPWWLHELIYQLWEVRSSLGASLVAMAERIGETVAFWSAAAMLGWITGSVWKGQLAIAIGVGAVMAVISLDEAWKTVELTFWGTFDVVLPEVSGTHGVALVTSAIAVTIILLVIQNRLTLWVTSAICGVAWFGGYGAGAWSQEALGIHRASVAPPKRLVVSEKQTRSFFNLDTSQGSQIQWSVSPGWAIISPDVMPWTHATGEIRFKEGTVLPAETRHAHIFPGRSASATDIELRHLISHFPDCMVSAYGAIRKQMIPLATSLESPVVVTEDQAMDAEAQLRTGIWRLEEPIRIPLDGNTVEAGTLGRTWIHEIAPSHDDSLAVRIRFYDHGGLSSRKIFALHHKNRKQLIVTRFGQSNRVSRGGWSNAPLTELEITFQSQELTNDATTEEWLAGAELILLEERFEGVVEQTLYQPGAEFSIRPKFTRNYSVNRYSQETRPPITFSDPSASDRELRESFYHLTRKPPEGDSASLSVADVHRSLLRDLVLNYPEAVTWFREFWTDSDGEYFLRKLADDPNRYWSTSSIEELANQRGWLRAHPELLKQIVRTLPHPSAVTLEAANAMGSAESGEALFRRQLEGNWVAVDRESYPEIWDDIFQEARANWDEEKWRIRLVRQLSQAGYQLARMGEPEPLREMLYWYTRWEPELDHHALKLYNYLPDDPWSHFRAIFPKSETASVRTVDQKIAAAERWLAAEWRYDPATMRYQILP